ncbi:MAG: hypothetical protein ACI8R8_003476, partial [Paraglaciecola sp.]
GIYKQIHLGFRAKELRPYYQVDFVHIAKQLSAVSA